MASIKGHTEYSSTINLNVFAKLRKGMVNFAGFQVGQPYQEANNRGSKNVEVQCGLAR
jgi:hypothetical protein